MSMDSETEKSLRCFYEEDAKIAEAMLNNLILQHPSASYEEFKRDCDYYYSRILNYPIAPPSVLQFDFMRRCQLQCRICKIWSRQATTPDEELTLDELKKLFDQAAELGISQCYFSGGEPFMLPFLFEIFNYAKGLGIKSEVTTNGLLLNEGNCRKLLELPVQQINISIDGATASTHDYHRNKPGLFDAVIKNVKQFAAMRESFALANALPLERPYIVMACVLTNKNFHEMMKYIQLAQEIGVIAFFQPYASENDNYYRRTDEDEFVVPPERLPLLFQEIDRVIEYKMNCGDPRFLSNTVDSLRNLKRYFSNELIAAPYCFAGFNRIIVLKDHRVNLCPGEIGDFSKSSLREIWFSKQAEDMRKSMRTCSKPCLMGSAYNPGPSSNDIFLITKRYLLHLQKKGSCNEAFMSQVAEQLRGYQAKLSGEEFSSEVEKLEKILEYLEKGGQRRP